MDKLRQDTINILRVFAALLLLLAALLSSLLPSDVIAMFAAMVVRIVIMFGLVALGLFILMKK